MNRKSRAPDVLWFLFSFLSGALLLGLLLYATQDPTSSRSSATSRERRARGVVEESWVGFRGEFHSSAHSAAQLERQQFEEDDYFGGRVAAGQLPTQKMLNDKAMEDLRRRQEILLTKGRNRSGPVLGCEQFRSKNYTWPEGLRTVAIVGNGPLTPSSRAEINAMDLVIRFNKLQSYVCGEKFDVWASRHGDAVSSRYWGIGQKLNLTGCPLSKLLQLSKNIWLLNGGDGPFNHFLNTYPKIKERGNYVWLDCRRWVMQYMRKYDENRRLGLEPSSQDKISPSSGWLVMMMLKDCAPPGARFHVFGFNWPSGQWPAHKVEEEHEEIRKLEESGLLTIHETQCKHKYHCNTSKTV